VFADELNCFAFNMASPNWLVLIKNGIAEQVVLQGESGIAGNGLR
jgi:hypothetical protein